MVHKPSIAVRILINTYPHLLLAHGGQAVEPCIVTPARGTPARCSAGNTSMVRDPSLTQAARRRLWSSSFMKCMDELGIPWENAQGTLQDVHLPDLEHRVHARWQHREWGHIDDLANGWSSQPCALRAAPQAFSRASKLPSSANWCAPEPWVRASRGPAI